MNDRQQFHLLKRSLELLGVGLGAASFPSGGLPGPTAGEMTTGEIVHGEEELNTVHAKAHKLCDMQDLLL